MDHLLDAQYVSIRLCEAGKSLLSLPSTGCFPAGFRSMWPQFAQAAVDAYGYGETEWQPPPPSAKAISEMEQAYSWVQLIPKDRVRLRRIVLMRSLVSPRTDRHIWSYKRIGKLFGCSESWIRFQNTDGVDLIVAGLNKAGLCARSGGPVGPSRADLLQELERAKIVSPEKARSKINFANCAV